jgi:hypothetical protein
VEGSNSNGVTGSGPARAPQQTTRAGCNDDQPDEFSPERDAAIATLIAAVPDMLAALKAWIADRDQLADFRDRSSTFSKSEANTV